MAKANPLDFEIFLRLRMADEGDHSREPDPKRDVFSVWIKGHSTCKAGTPRRVAFTGEKRLDAEGVQVGGRICWVVEHGLHKRDMLKVQEYVAAWQSNQEAIEASREDIEEQW